MVNFMVTSEGLNVNFTDSEMDRLINASGNPANFSSATMEIIDAAQRPECCRPLLFNRQSYHAQDAVRRSEQLASSSLSPDEVHELGEMIGLAMFGSRTPAEQPTFEGALI